MRHLARTDSGPTRCPLASLEILSCARAIRGGLRSSYRANSVPGIGTGLAPLLSLQLLAVEVTDIERRVAKLKKALVTNKLVG